jgi:hypothetical protein
MRSISFALLLGCSAVCAGQQQPSVAAQRAAMKKLEFLAGKWSGDASVVRGPSGPLKLVQTEDVQYKMDGLIMLVEGTGRNSEGQIVFRALATISYDDTASTYRFRAYSDGRYLDTELTVTMGGFAWGYTAGQVKVSNTMHLDEKGQWVETTDAIVGSSPSRRSLEMTLKRQE